MRSVAPFAWVCSVLVLAGCRERSRPAGDSTPPPSQAIAADKPTAVDSPTAYHPHDADQPTMVSKADDGNGFYVPTTRIVFGALDGYSIESFSLLHRGSIETRDASGPRPVTHCSERVATQDTLHLSCIDPVLGTLTIDGHFLVPRVEDGVLPKTLDDDLVEAIVTVKRNGRMRFAERHRFRWASGE